MKLVYFAWVRERIGIDEETISLPDNVTNVSQLLTWLKDRGEGYAAALEHSNVIRVAVDQEHADAGDSIVHAREVALFPPMTGG